VSLKVISALRERAVTAKDYLAAIWQLVVQDTVLVDKTQSLKVHF